MPFEVPVSPDSDLVQLRALVDCYAITLDSLDAPRLSSLWMNDSTLVVREEGPKKPHTAQLAFPAGAELVIKRLQRYERTLHHVTTHVATVKGDTATATTYCQAHHILRERADGPIDKVLSIRYEDAFQRSNGWRFLRREINVLLRTMRSVESL
jgi:SnoaL-like domain